MKCSRCDRHGENKDEILVSMIEGYCKHCDSDLETDYSFCSLQCAIEFLKDKEEKNETDE